jgi:rhamnogalacturonan endolyase
MKKSILILTLFLLLILSINIWSAGPEARQQTKAPRQMEYLDRGVIAMRSPGDSVYVGWRMLGTEPDDIEFNIYRQSGSEKPSRLNKKPISESTNFTDGTVNLLTDNSYFIKAVLNGKEQILLCSNTLIFL